MAKKSRVAQMQGRSTQGNGEGIDSEKVKKYTENGMEKIYARKPVYIRSGYFEYAGNKSQQLQNVCQPDINPTTTGWRTRKTLLKEGCSNTFAHGYHVPPYCPESKIIINVAKFDPAQWRTRELNITKVKGRNQTAKSSHPPPTHSTSYPSSSAYP